MTPSSASRVPQSPSERASGTRLTRGWPWHRHQHWRADGIGTRELPQQRCDGRRERGGAELDRWHFVGLLSQEWLVLSCGSSFALLKLNCNWEKEGKVDELRERKEERRKERKNSKKVEREYSLS
ncbi:hypothetical protein BO79DRAFT_6358 [Aspergillus costaricaensis CBS 115574]|uniref:Uncharacterized protein n=1 Tax=Aspergillus costaricaensis CBS 115574 TaxID=1448317 RepID=A0ACD1IK57_9EURO|nr:hypothetical protein BO79DRAFT_6358 [Aspergillus costaricaensis CBS 115574]RAK90673.1 hypothetical protein BO79DRAFT_6358 [Aspergillus costaricaensis CBS 115574]